MTLPIDLDCFTPDNRRAVVLRVQKSAPARRGLFPVRCITHGLRTFPDLTERLSALFECISSQLRGGLRLPVFSRFQWLAIPFRVVSPGRGDALPTSGMRSLGSFPFHALQHVRQDQSERLQSKTSTAQLSDVSQPTGSELLNGKILFAYGARTND